MIPRPPNRVSVVGVSGSGKTTLATKIAEHLQIPRLELDSVFHLEDWTARDPEEFRTVVADFTSQERWVVDGNYAPQGVLDIVWAGADTVVWVDPPRHTVMRRIIWRSLRRSFTGEVLWNGNTESPRSLLRWDPEENIVRWAWTQYSPVQARYETRSTDARW
jgi:adenylate kinase family enzyme